MMNNESVFHGPAGVISCVVEWPNQEPEGVALILHPHPLFGGTRDNKVVTTLGRACLQKNLVVLRPNFRGVGDSEGEHDMGEGETVDMTGLVLQFLNQYPNLRAQPLVLGGFSFGSAVVSRVFHELQTTHGLTIERLMLMGLAVNRFPVPSVPKDTLLVHGELDDVVPLTDVMNWARDQELVIQVIPGADHFFNRKLTILKRAVLHYLETK